MALQLIWLRLRAFLSVIKQIFQATLWHTDSHLQLIASLEESARCGIHYPVHILSGYRGSIASRIADDQWCARSLRKRKLVSVLSGLVIPGTEWIVVLQGIVRLKDTTAKAGPERQLIFFDSCVNNIQQVFLKFVQSHYASVGVEELDQTKLTPLLRMKYQHSLADAVADLGKPDEIGKVFSGFQKYLYQQHP